MTKVLATRMHTLSGHTDCVYALESGKSARQVFSGAGDGMIVAWDLTKPKAGELIARLPNSIYALHYMPDADILIAGHNYDGIHAIDWSAKKEIRSLQTGSAAIFDIKSYNANIMIASGDGVVTIVDSNTWRVAHKIAHSDKSARSMDVNPGKGEFAVGYSDFSIRVFGLERFELRYEWVAHTNSVFTVAYSPDFKTLLSGSRDARLKSWDAAGSYALKHEVVAHLYAINNIAFSPDGKHFVTCSLDKSIKVWAADEMKLLKVIDKARHAGHGTSVNKVLWTSFEHAVLSASDDRTMSVWELLLVED